MSLVPPRVRLLCVVCGQTATQVIREDKMRGRQAVVCGKCVPKGWVKVVDVGDGGE